MNDDYIITESELMDKLVEFSREKGGIPKRIIGDMATLFQIGYMSGFNQDIDGGYYVTPVGKIKLTVYPVPHSGRGIFLE